MAHETKGVAAMLGNQTSGQALGEPSAAEAKRVLVPLALGHGDKEAILHAVAVARDLQAEIVLLHVITPFYLINSGMIPLVWPIRYTDEQDYEDAKSYIVKLADKLIPKNQPWCVRITEGNAFDRIIRIAEELHPALMVIPPAPSHSLAQRLLFGGLRRRLLRASACMVEEASETTTTGAGSS